MGVASSRGLVGEFLIQLRLPLFAAATGLYANGFGGLCDGVAQATGWQIIFGDPMRAIEITYARHALPPIGISAAGAAVGLRVAL